ncbi:D-alanyl-D-alanine carboxypeptidase DacF [Chlamydiales bacterium STE3]|nr:D-alanyl-D-alanine carboxypeptidase DacF [Chlamydiales bacterium STE3]
MKRKASAVGKQGLFFFFLVILCKASLFSESLVVPVKAQAAILINADTQAILFEKNAFTKHYPASITKIATAAYALHLKPDHLNNLISAEQESIASITEEAKRKANFTHPAYWIEIGSSHIGIKRGEELSFKDLLHGMLIATANDASNVIAQFAAGSIPKFVEGLNQYIQQLGCKDTKFCNPHGLHHPQHQTTAYDMALVTVEALKNPIIREIVHTVRYTRPKTNKQGPTVMMQTNRLLRSGDFYYSKAIGVKTGKTSQANNTFVAAAQDGERTLIAVLLNVKERDDIFKDAIRLFDTAFNQPKMERMLVKAGKQKYSLQLDGADKPIKTYTKESASLTYYPAEEPKIKAYLKWEKRSLPVVKGEKVGELVLSNGDKNPYKVLPLYAEETVTAGFMFSIKKYFSEKQGFAFLQLLGIGCAILMTFLIIKKFVGVSRRP